MVDWWDKEAYSREEESMEVLQKNVAEEIREKDE